MEINKFDNETTCFAQNLRKLMKQYHFKNVALARRLKVSKSTISNYLNGTSKPSIDKLIELSYLFCCPLDILLKPPAGSTLREDPAASFQMIPLFHMQINEYVENIFTRENFDSSFYFPIPIRDEARCYAVRIREKDAIKAENIPERCYAIFSLDELPQDGDIVAVHLKGKGCIAVKQLSLDENKSIILRSDKEELIIPFSEKDEKINILGKVIYKILAV